MVDFTVPRQAIAAFEELHALRFTLHDLCGSLWPFVDPDRLRHGHPLCVAMKESRHLPRCMAFDLAGLRAALPELPAGRCHICHAGLVEWVVPVYRGLAVEWILFAGVRTADPGLVAHREALTLWARPPWGSRTLPPPVMAVEAERILEHLRQLAARLWLWTLERESALADPVPRSPSGTVPADAVAIRRTLIHRFIAEHHRADVRLGDLAVHLGIGEDRAGRVIKECCGRSFRKLLGDARLRTATELLRNTDLPVLQVALRSGFNEVAHFNRVFHRRMGTTPTRFRRQADV